MLNVYRRRRGIVFDIYNEYNKRMRTYTLIFIFTCFLVLGTIYIRGIIECVTLRAEGGIQTDMATIIDCSY